MTGQVGEGGRSARRTYLTPRTGYDRDRSSILKPGASVSPAKRPGASATVRPSHISRAGELTPAGARMSLLTVIRPPSTPQI